MVCNVMMLQGISVLGPQRLYMGTMACSVMLLQRLSVLGPQGLYMGTIVCIWRTIVCSAVLLQGSSVSGPRGLYVGDEVRSMSGCQVSGITDWLMCINGAMAARTSSGYECMPLPLLDKYNIALDGTTVFNAHLYKKQDIFYVNYDFSFSSKPFYEGLTPYVCHLLSTCLV